MMRHPFGDDRPSGRSTISHESPTPLEVGETPSGLFVASEDLEDDETEDWIVTNRLVDLTEVA